MVWLLDARDVPAPTLAAAERSLSAAARRRADAMIRPARRQQFVLARALLRFIGLRHCGGDASALQIAERPDDAPVLKLATGVVPHFSLSHSWPWIACATSHASAVGLDVEVIDASRDAVALSEYVFTADEHQWLLAQRDRTGAFYRLWTAREAKVKLASRLGGATFAMHLHYEHPIDGLALTVASSAPAGRPVIRHVSADEQETLSASDASGGAMATSCTSSPGP
jgi:4'-phosphopantetheinyl transferase